MSRFVVERGGWFLQGKNAWVRARDCATLFDERDAKRWATVHNGRVEPVNGAERELEALSEEEMGILRKQHDEWCRIRDEMVAAAKKKGEGVSAYEVTREQTKRMWARGERPARLLFEGAKVRMVR